MLGEERIFARMDGPPHRKHVAVLKTISIEALQDFSRGSTSLRSRIFCGVAIWRLAILIEGVPLIFACSAAERWKTMRREGWL